VALVCCLECVISIMIISVDGGSCLSGNVSFNNTDLVGPSSIDLRNVSDKQNIQTKHKPHLFLNG